MTIKNLKEVYRILLKDLRIQKINEDTAIVTMLDKHVDLLTSFVMQNKIYKSIRKDDPNIKHIYFTTNKLFQNILSYGKIVTIKKNTSIPVIDKK